MFRLSVVCRSAQVAQRKSLSASKGVGLAAALAATSLALLCSRPAGAQSGAWDFNSSTFNLEEAKTNGVDDTTNNPTGPAYFPLSVGARIPSGANGTFSASAKGTARIIATWTPPYFSSGAPIPKPPATVTVRIFSSTTAEYFNDSNQPSFVQASSPELNNGFDDPKQLVGNDPNPVWGKIWESSGWHLKTFSTKDAQWNGTRYILALPLDIKMSSSVKVEGSYYHYGAVSARLSQPYVTGDNRSTSFYANPNDVVAILKDEPNDKEIDAYAKLDWFNDGVIENPLTRIFSGSSTFHLTATNNGNSINLQNYKWSTSPSPYTPSTPPASTGSDSSKSYSWSLGNVADTDPSSFPKSTITTVTAVDPSDGAQISGKAKINWHLTPAMLYEFKIKHEPIVSDGDDPADATEMQVIQEYKQGYRDAFGTIGTGMKTTLAVGEIVVNVMMPDEFDLALGAGKAFKLGKALAKAAPKIAPVFRQILTGLNNRRVAKGKRPYLGLKTTTEVTNKGKVGTRHPSVVYGEADEAAGTTEKATEFIGSSCFVAGTPIKMADGSWKVIEQIKVGDQVLSRSEATKVTEAKRVSQTFVKQAPSTLVLTFSNKDRIETTADHPFYVEGKGFVNAGELGIGTAIVTRAGPSLLVLDVQRKDVPATVYNFEVEDFHTYFVGNSALWVHNNNDCTNFDLPAEPAGKGILATLSPDGVLDFAVYAGEGSSIPGHIMFAKMMEHFGDAVKAIGGNWTSGTNLDKINDLTSDGSMISAEKVLLTWTGRQATAHGFTNVSIVSYVGTPGNYTKVNVIFTRP